MVADGLALGAANLNCTGLAFAKVKLYSWAVVFPSATRITAVFRLVPVARIVACDGNDCVPPLKQTLSVFESGNKAQLRLFSPNHPYNYQNTFSPRKHLSHCNVLTHSSHQHVAPSPAHRCTPLGARCLRHHPGLHRQPLIIPPNSLRYPHCEYFYCLLSFLVPEEAAGMTSASPNPLLNISPPFWLNDPTNFPQFPP